MEKVRNLDPEGNVIFHVALDTDGNLQPIINVKLCIDDFQTLGMLLGTDNIGAVELSVADGRRYALLFDDNYCKPYPSIMIWRYENKDWGSLIIDMEQDDLNNILPFVSLRSNGMFEKQYRFFGSHAERVAQLTAIIDEDSRSKLFDRNLDVYINAPLIGFLYNRKAIKNNDVDVSPQNIFPEQMINASDKLKYILQLILLLDAENEPDEEKRLDLAFRTIGTEEDLLLFDKYVLGGVDVCVVFSPKRMKYRI